MITRSDFDLARFTVLGESYGAGGIGVLSERSMHRILKLCIEPREEFHEVKLLGSVADIMNGERVYEIQTKAFARLKPKLEKFLPHYPVTVVYPLVYEKYIRWIDKETGETSTRRKSPKRSTVFDSFYELYNIREFLCDKNLTVKLVLLNVEEYKYRVSIKGRRKRSERLEQIPTSIVREVDLSSPDDYRIFIPDGLAPRFCAADFNRAVGKGFSYGYSGISILRSVGLVSDGVKEGRKTLYEIIN